MIEPTTTEIAFRHVADRGRPVAAAYLRRHPGLALQALRLAAADGETFARVANTIERAALIQSGSYVHAEVTAARASEPPATLARLVRHPATLARIAVEVGCDVEDLPEVLDRHHPVLDVEEG